MKCQVNDFSYLREAFVKKKKNLAKAITNYFFFN